MTRQPTSVELGSYWSRNVEWLVGQLGSAPDGLSSEEASNRLRTFGRNRLGALREHARSRILISQLRNPLLLILVVAVIASAFTRAWFDAAIILAIIGASVGIGYSREASAHAALAVLQRRIRVQAVVRRDGREVRIPVEEVVPGDVVTLSAGSLVPADGVLLDAADCFVSEAAITGESFPVVKRPGPVAGTATLRERTNSLFLGTNVRSGTARYLVVQTGTATEFGAIAKRLVYRQPETEFDRGLRQFGGLLTNAMVVLVLLVFAGHLYRQHSPMETMLFSIALAVGLSPELLPAILSVNLARGARAMAHHGVIVRRLNAIENLGSMDILCTDKTGTLTEGVVEVEGAYDWSGATSPAVLELAAINSALETGLNNPLDEAIGKACRAPIDGTRKLAEIPFDFLRKRVSVVIAHGSGGRLITKGSFRSVLDICDRGAGGQALDAAIRQGLINRYEHWSAQGIRVLAVATRGLARKPSYHRDDEHDLELAGFVAFLDRPKEGVSAAIRQLAALGVAIKVITGDSKEVARHVSGLVGLRTDRLLTGAELGLLHDEALWHVAERTDLFAEVDPNQKERLILALKRMGHVVGFLGDGVNDAPAMHAADTSLSVDQAVDVAREAADFVLLERDLDVIRRGIEEGRRTFANTLKYVLTTTSANLGNMVSMALASLFLPFLPLLPSQILLNNFLSDIPAIGLADDAVDRELVAKPERWNVAMIGRFMVTFGIVSSAFDLAMFAILTRVFAASAELFRTGWFVESLLTELVIALVVRTRRPFYASRPSRMLLVSTVGLVVVAFALPYLPIAGTLGFVPLPGSIVLTVCLVTLGYVIAVETIKRFFYQMPA